MSTTRQRKPQCKDIPDQPILEMLAKNPEQGYTWRFDKWNIGEAMPPGTPAKLVLAKMGSLIKRQLVSGCACGCRGDFRISPKGIATLVVMKP